MGLSVIQTKLQKFLLKDSFEESDVVYILSRIRKILEIEGKSKEKEYKKLKFYCDWALHKQIDNTDPVSEELKDFPEDMSGGNKIILHRTFHEELRKFLKEYKIETTIYKTIQNTLDFGITLAEIYADTPLIIKYTKKKIITTKAGKVGLIKLKDGSKVKVPYIEFTVKYEG